MGERLRNQFRIELSNDDRTWSPAYSTTTGTGSTQVLNVTGTARYVRLYGSTRATGFRYSLWEFEIYGTVDTSTTNPPWFSGPTRPPAPTPPTASRRSTSRPAGDRVNLFFPQTRRGAEVDFGEGRPQPAPEPQPDQLAARHNATMKIRPTVPGRGREVMLRPTITQTTPLRRHPAHDSPAPLDDLHGTRTGERGESAANSRADAIDIEAADALPALECFAFCWAAGESYQVIEPLTGPDRRSKHGKPFFGHTINAMLSNRLYLGVSGFREVVVPDAHEALTDPDMFEQCQRILTTRGEPGSSRAASNSGYYLTGLITCPECGCKYVSTSATGKLRRYHYYTCFSRVRYGRQGCTAPRIDADQLDAAVAEALVDFFTDTDLITEAITNEYELRTANAPDRDSLARQIATTQASRSVRASHAAQKPLSAYLRQPLSARLLYFRAVPVSTLPARSSMSGTSISCAT